MTVTPIDFDNRIQLPADWMQNLGLHGLVVLERTDDGILLRPWLRMTWKDIFAAKLSMGSAPPSTADEEAVEVTGDEFLF